MLTDLLSALEKANTPMDMDERTTAMCSHLMNVLSLARNSLGSTCQAIHVKRVGDTDLNHWQW